VQVNKLIPLLAPEHFTLDEKMRNATLTDEGNEFIDDNCTRQASA
jgi:preprotein translocase subunit SecA